ncbi:protein family CysZ [Ophiocordyceps camponoti-floridani]|uniref:Protein family CysZ n=1 Tax=Ophiocordyceps camponoti-floridani TaxID=2030778 RepID=A0A8H4Q2A5_9HYPO|nr:protein family CysZ [Ophiocordyceps camponoti-floridani]
MRVLASVGVLVASGLIGGPPAHVAAYGPPDGGSGAEVYGEPGHGGQGDGSSAAAEGLPAASVTGPTCMAGATTTVFVTVFPTSPASADDSVSAAGVPQQTTVQVSPADSSPSHSVSIWTTVTWNLSGLGLGSSGSLIPGSGSSPTSQGSDGDYGNTAGSSAAAGWPRPTATSIATGPSESGASGGDVGSASGSGLTAASDGSPSAYNSANTAQASPSDNGQNGAGSGPAWQTVVTDTEVHWVPGPGGPTPVTVMSEHTVFEAGPTQASAAGEPVTCLTTTGPDGRPTVLEWPAGRPQPSVGPVVSTAGVPGDNGNAGAQAASAPGDAASTTCTTYTVLGTDGVPTIVHSSWLVPQAAPITAAPGPLPSGVQSGPISVQGVPGGAGVTTCTSFTLVGADGKLTVVESTYVLPGTAGVQGGASGNLPAGAPAPVTTLHVGSGPAQSAGNQLPGGGYVTCTSFTVLGADGLPTVVDTTFVAPGPAATPVTTIGAGGVFTGAPAQITGSAALPPPGGAGPAGVTTCLTFTTLGADGKPTVVESTVVVPATPATVAPGGVFTGAPAQITGSAVLPQPANAGSQGVATCITITTLGPDGKPTVVESTVVMPASPTASVTPGGVFTGAPAQITNSAVLPQPGNSGSQGVTTCITLTTLGPDGKPTVVESTVVVPATPSPAGAFTGAPAQITNSAVLPQAGNSGFQGVTTCITITTLGPDGKPTVVESTIIVPASSALPPVTVLGLPSPPPVQASNLPQGAPVFTSLGSPITTCLTFDVLGPNGVATPVVRTVVLTPAAAPSATTLGYSSITAQQQATDLPQGVSPAAVSNGAITTCVTMFSVGPNGVATPIVQTVVLTPTAAALGLPTAPQAPDAAGLTVQPPGPVVQGSQPTPLAPGPSLNAYGADMPAGQGPVLPSGLVSGLGVTTLTGPFTTVVTIVGGQPGASGAAGLPFPYGDGSGVSAAGVGAQPGDANGNAYGGSRTSAGPYGPQSQPAAGQPLMTVTTLQTLTWTNIIPEPTTTYTMNFPLTTLETVTISAPLGKRVLRRQQSSLPLNPSWSNATSAFVPPVVESIPLQPVPTPWPAVPSPVPAVPSPAAPVVPSVPGSGAVCPFGGRIGNMTVDFDDLKPGPLFNPSGDMWFSEGFLVAPPAAQIAQSFVPSSGGQLAEFVPPSLAGMSFGHQGSGDRAEVGVGPNAAKPCFRFDFFSAELGCAATAVEGWCEFEVAAYRFNPGLSFEQSIAWSETKRVPACPNFPSGSCSLTHVDFEGYTNISSVLINVRVGLEIRAWWGDDFKFGWSDNSCEAASCRALAAPQHAKRETVELALSRGVWHWTPAGLQRLDDSFIRELAH